jgi:hypothetical protein
MYILTSTPLWLDNLHGGVEIYFCVTPAQNCLALTARLTLEKLTCDCIHRMTSTAEVIKEFASITGANADTSRFYLESSGWDIGVRTRPIWANYQLNVFISHPQAATEMFFESGGQPVSAAAAGAPPPAAGRAASPPAPRPAQSQPKRYEASSTNLAEKEDADTCNGDCAVGCLSLHLCSGGGIRGFSDLGADEEEGKKQNYYTGGKSSGMMVEDPQGPPSGSSNDIVSQLMENARRYPPPLLRRVLYPPVDAYRAPRAQERWTNRPSRRTRPCPVPTSLHRRRYTQVFRASFVVRPTHAAHIAAVHRL